MLRMIHKDSSLALAMSHPTVLDYSQPPRFHCDEMLGHLARFLREVKALLGREVDVVTEAGLRSRIKQRVLKEARPI